MYIKNSLRIAALTIFMISNNSCATITENAAALGTIIAPVAGSVIIGNCLKESSFNEKDALGLAAATVTTWVSLSYIDQNTKNIIYGTTTLLSMLGMFFSSR